MSAAAPAHAPSPAEARRAARAPGHAWPSAAARRELVLGLLLLTLYGFFRQVPGWNEYSRYDLVAALVEQGTTRIDRYHRNTGDKAFFDGHYYSDKAPGSSFLGVPAYALLRAATGRPDPLVAVHLLAVVVSGLPTMLTTLLLLRFLRRLVPEWWALTVALGLGLGTIAFTFATMYYGHAATMACLFGAFCLLWGHRPGDRPWRALGAGLLAGWAVLVDVGALLGVGVLLLCALRRDRRAPFLMAAGAVPPALLLLGYNWVSFGGPFNLGYRNLTDPGYADAMGRGVLGVTLPRLDTLAEILVGPRGLLRLSPWLAAAPLGLLAARRREARPLVLVCAAVVLLYVASNAGYHEPLGGWSPGPRFLTTALPFLAILVALAPAALRPLVAALAALSALIVLLPTATAQNVPSAVADPLADLWLPRVLDGYPGETTAWLYWGLHGGQPFLVLGLAVLVAAVGLLATTRATRAANRLNGASIGALLLLLLGFGLPFNLPGALGLGRPPTEDRVNVAIARAGTTPVPSEDGRTLVEAWAQLENRGRATEATIVFTAYDTGGRPVWSVPHRRVPWRERDRKHLWAQWSPSDAPPGEYRVEVAITSVDGRTMLGRVESLARVRVSEAGVRIDD